MRIVGEYNKYIAILATITFMLCVLLSPMAAFQSQAASPLPTGSYYINSFSEGMFLGRTTTSPTTSSIKGISGKVSSIGSRAAWYIQICDGAYCTFRSSSSSTYYMSSTSNGTVIYESKTTPNDYCKWKLVMTNQGITVQNKATGYYLFMAGTTVGTSSSAMSLCYWRAVLTTNYGSGSSYYYQELSSFTVSDKSINIFGTASISINRYPSSGTILWASATDFSFSANDPSVVSISASGVVTGVSPGKTRVTIEHKPTGYTGWMYITVHASSGMFGTQNAGHDHQSALVTAVNYMNSYSGTTGNYCSYKANHSLEEVKNILAYSRLFISRTHGLEYNNSGDATGIQISCVPEEWLVANNIFNFNTSTQELVLGDLVICTFVGCYTAAGTESIAKAAYLSGSLASVGFADEINCDYANRWTETYAYKISNNYSVYDACEAALHNGWYFVNITYNLDDYNIYGNENTTF